MSSSNHRDPRRGRRRTETSAFGSPGRIGHDSTSFYGSRLYSGSAPDKAVPYHENPLPPDVVNRIFCKSSESMDELPDCSVHLMVTSPPYNVGKEYDEDLSLEEYLSLLKRVMAEVHRVLVPGGRACVNVANLGRRPYIPLHIYVIQDMLDLGFLMRGEVIWDKSSSASPSTAWGSWMSAANPVLRDTHEYVLVFSKGRLWPKEPGESRQHHIQGGVPGVHQERMDLSGGVGQKGGTPRPLPRGAAPQVHPALHLRGRRSAGPVHGQRHNGGGGARSRALLRGL